MNNKITIAYSDQYNIDDFKNLRDTHCEIQYRRYIQKSIEAPAIIIIGFCLSCFVKGFFTKAGERIGDSVGSAISQKICPNLKKTMPTVLFKKDLKRPTLLICIESNNYPLIKIFLKANNKEILENNLNKVKEIYMKVLGIISKQNKKVKEVTITLYNHEITDFFYITEDQNIYYTNT